MPEFKKITTYKKEPEKILEEVSIQMSQKSNMHDFILIRQLIGICAMHRCKNAFTELLNIGTKEIIEVPKKEKEYEKIIENEITILIYLN